MTEAQLNKHQTFKLPMVSCELNSHWRQIYFLLKLLKSHRCKCQKCIIYGTPVCFLHFWPPVNIFQNLKAAIRKDSDFTLFINSTKYSSKVFDIRSENKKQYGKYFQCHLFQNSKFKVSWSTKSAYESLFRCKN